MREYAPVGGAELRACDIGVWVPRARGFTIKTELINLTDAARDALLADGVDTDHEALAPLKVELDAAIERLGGAVFPKLNWSAPTDAAWILGGSAKCTSAEDVLLLLQASDRAAHDLCDAWGLSDEGVLPPGAAVPDGHRWVVALRKWSELRPAQEYRCFRAGGGAAGALSAACQRDRHNHYPELCTTRKEMLARLEEFGRRVLPAAPARLVWDAYVDRTGKVFLVDLAPFHESTDPLLFEWDELWSLAAAAGAAEKRPEVELRLVPPGGGSTVVPTARIYNGLPSELRGDVGGGGVEQLLANARSAAVADEDDD